MKQRRLFSLSFTLIVAFALAPLAVSVLAQDQELRELKKGAAEMAAAQNREDKIRAEMLKVVAAKIGFEMKVVKGAPYSAIAEAETVQALADGNRIRNKTTTLVYRDNEGRTRREVVGKEQSLPTEVFISDPASGVNYSLDTQRRVALKTQVNLQELDLEKMKFAAEMELKQREMKRQTQAGGQVVRAEDEEIVKKKRQPIVESLGQQIIEGVLCEGRRATFTIPAGEAGNEQPIITVNEQWYSPDLQVYVLTKQSDPRTGETIYRLTNINRSEPDRALFEVPADYTLKDESALPAKKKRRPEEEK
jgi:hypothetical protein